MSREEFGDTEHPRSVIPAGETIMSSLCEYYIQKFFFFFYIFFYQMQSDHLNGA